MRSSLAIILVALLATSALAQDHCNAYMTCQQCVSSYLCGWCSTKVAYQNGAPGFQCAGFNKNGSNPFVCNGVYSTDTCQRGWACNETTYQCQQTAPGTGDNQDTCEAKCSTVGKTFICDNSTFTCKLAPAGEGTSLQQCQSECMATQNPASHNPASQNPASNNPASNNPSSNQPSTSSPQPTSAPTYLCNGTSQQCYQAPVGQGASLLVCQQGCKPSNVTPPTLLGLWRTFPIDEKTPVRETDVYFYSNNSVGIRSRTEDALCQVVSIGQEVHFVGCTTGQPDLRCIYETSLTMPETYHAMLACNYNNGAAPASFTAAMSAAAQGQPVAVVFMTRCVPDGFCQFHFGPTSAPPPLSRRGAAAQSAIAVATTNSLAATDPCTAFGSNCSFCLSHPYCGWCSAVVTYKDGTVGSQCAGFSSDPRKKNEWTCSGSYSTELCLPGWVCNPSNQTCTPTTPGSGVPQQDCQTSCKAQPGPPSQLIGNWRGLFIQQGYPYGIVTVNITQTQITVALDGTTLFTGSMKSLAADVFITYTSGPNAGKTIAGIYTNDQNEVIEYIEIAFGGDNEAAPANYKDGMQKPNIELVLAKCASANCQF